MARRGTLQVHGRNHWTALGQADFWSFHHFHLHSFRQLDWAYSRRRGWWGGDIRTNHGFVIDQPLFRGANADVNMTPCYGSGVLCLLDRVGRSEVRVDGFPEGVVCPKG